MKMNNYFEDLPAQNFDEIYSSLNESDKLNNALHENFKISFNKEDNEMVSFDNNRYFCEQQNQITTGPKTKTIPKFTTYSKISHKKDSLDNIIVKANNKVIKSAGNYINEKITKNGIKYLIIRNINTEIKKNLFKNKKDKLDFLNLTFKKLFLMNHENENIIKELEEKNHELAEILNTTFEEYFETYRENKISKDLKDEKEQNYINKYKEYCNNPREIINGIKERKPRNISN